MLFPFSDLLLTTSLSQPMVNQIISLLLNFTDYVDISFKQTLMSFYKSQSKTIVKNHVNKKNWYVLSGNYLLSEQFFEKHLDKVNWYSLSRNPSVSEQFFEKHLDKVNLERLSVNPSISRQFFEQYSDKVKCSSLSINSCLSKQFYKRCLNKIGLNVHVNNSMICSTKIDNFFNFIQF
ncbi:Uncharacterised protein [uncultured archaeon]|nr:Uncharacterised protein [uncultured archaeon]